MYKKHDGQITIAEFYSPFGNLDPKNRWVQVANLIPWSHLEERYAQQFCNDNGAPAINFRMALGTLIIKQMTGHSDDIVIQDILENPYMQFLIGLHEFTIKAPFAQSSVTNFRKYISADMLAEANEYIFGKRNSDDNDNPPTDGVDNNEESPKQSDKPNRGTLMHDATCTPANIGYPTDVNLLNEAREKLEGIVDVLYPYSANRVKPRTYRNNARRDYMSFSKVRKPRKKSIHKAIKRQLQYVKRTLGHVDSLIKEVGENHLTLRQKEWLFTIRKLYQQQQDMYTSGSHSVQNRIVSISQPHVRPIVRGKVKAPVEFGAKVSISLIDGYAYVDKIGWNGYSEESLLIPAIEQYKALHGYYPEAVLADKIYRNRSNLNYCKERNIRLSGPKLGRPSKDTVKQSKKQEKQDSSERNAVEGKFGEGKTKYGLNRIMAQLKDSSETVIMMSFFCMNISKRLRSLLQHFLLMIDYGMKIENSMVFE